MNLKIKKFILYFLFLILILITTVNVLAQDIIINEIMASNKSSFQDSDSDFDDWFELKNIGAKPVNLSGYYLSDKKDNLTLWQFDKSKDFILQPGDYLLIWADEEMDEKGIHTNFKLSSSGETITLAKADGNKIVDQVSYPEIMTDISYGRKLTNINEWGYFVFPTPNEDNNFNIPSYYWVEKLKFAKNNKLISLFLIASFLIILLLLFSYYRKNKELKMNKIKYEKLFLKSPVGLLICDLKGNILEINKEMINLLGAPSKKVVKEINLNDVLIIKDIWANEFVAAADKEEIEGEIKYTTRWDKTVYLKYKVEVIEYSNISSEVIIAVNDISREKKIEKKLLYLSFNDSLTGLYNRRYFENELERLNKSRMLPISIIIGDLDKLKYINDNFGHKMGDKYIIKIADIMKKNFRAEDIAARIGGDEFAVILPGINTETAAKIAERIKRECDKNKEYNYLGISIGYATKSKHSENLEGIFMKADKELYKDKNIN